MQTKEQKKIIIDSLADKLKNAKSVIFSDYKGLKVKDMMSLRKDLKKEGADLKVAKKTLINLAFKKNGLDFNVKEMEGQLAVATSEEDEVVAARIISAVAKNNENIKIIGGFLGDKKMSAEEVKALAKLPSKQELLSKFVGTINAPVSGFVNVLAGNIRGFVQVLKAISEK